MNEKQFEPISVRKLTLEPNYTETHKHSVYQFVFIQSGTGTHTKNAIDYNYTHGDLFLIRKNELHTFKTTTTTLFYILQFSEQAKRNLKELTANASGYTVALSKAQSPNNPKVSFAGKEFDLVLSIFEIVLQLVQFSNRNENICYFQIMSLIAIIERNLNYHPEENTSRKDKKHFAFILRHIHKNIQEPDMLSLDFIANKFSMSVNTLSNHFKKEIKMTTKQYIHATKVEALKNNVAKTNESFTQIANQFGFIDESHFSKYFKNKVGMSPTQFRKKSN
ncbi:AraC family transcriptional regulator [Myroides sp. LJL119]